MAISIGISKTFPMDLDLIARLMQFYGEQPGANLEKIGTAVGLNTPKIRGLNSLMGFLGLQERRKLTPLGEQILKNDPYLRDEGTLCVFHYWLCANEKLVNHKTYKPEVWRFVSNEFIPRNRQFTRKEFNQAIDEASIGIGRDKHLKSDEDLFLNAYTTKEYRALQSLQYLKKVEGINDTYRATAIEKVSAMVLGFVLYDRRQRGMQTSTISINNLLTMEGQIGKIFLLQREQLMVKLKQLEAKGVIGISQIADLDSITFKHLDDPLSLLADYYREQL